MSTNTQYRLILAHLKAGGHISRDTCEVAKFGFCQRLPARTGEMKDAGYQIGSIWIVGRTGTRIKQYFMQKETEDGA